MTLTRALHTRLAEVSVSTAPAVEPVVKADLTSAGDNYAKIGHTTDDDLIDDMIVAARVQAEKYTNRAFINQTIIALYDTFSSKVVLPRAPHGTISEVVQIASDNTETSLTENTDYWLKGIDKKWLYIPSGVSIPAGVHPRDDTRGDQLKVTFAAGYGASATDVPEGIRLAIMKTVATWYESRQDFATGTILLTLPESSKQMLAPYKYNIVF